MTELAVFRVGLLGEQRPPQIGTTAPAAQIEYDPSVWPLRPQRRPHHSRGSVGLDDSGRNLIIQKVKPRTGRLPIWTHEVIEDHVRRRRLILFFRRDSFHTTRFSTPHQTCNHICSDRICRVTSPLCRVAYDASRGPPIREHRRNRDNHYVAMTFVDAPLVPASRRNSQAARIARWPRFADLRPLRRDATRRRHLRESVRGKPVIV